MKESTMKHLFKRPAGLVSFCERCASVCTRACRQDAILGAARDKSLALGGRFA